MNLLSYTLKFQKICQLSKRQLLKFLLALTQIEYNLSKWSTKNYDLLFKRQHYFLPVITLGVKTKSVISCTCFISMLLALG